MPEEYYLYLRKSRKDVEAELNGEGDTLARHEKILLELAKKRNLQITRIYREIVSGESISARPEMQKLLRDVEQGFCTGVLVMEVERLARGDTSDQGVVAKTFKYSDTLIITPEKTYDPNNEYDEEYFEFGLFMSRREYKTIRRRLQQGRLVSVKEGKFVGSRAPFGYEKVKLEKEKGYTLKPIPEQAETIKLIYTLYTKGVLDSDGMYVKLGTKRIADKLNEIRIPSPTGNEWDMGTIRDMLINPVYTGKIRWNWRPTIKKMENGAVQVSRPRMTDTLLVEGRHEAIIDQETFDLAQKYIQENKCNTFPGSNSIKSPLSGIIYCGVCGKRMNRRPPSGNSNAPDYLLCSTKGCRNIGAPMQNVEDHIIKSLDVWLRDYKIKISGADEISTAKLNQNVIKKIDEEIATLYKQLDTAHNLLEQGVYSSDMFFARSKVLNERIQQACENKMKLESEAEAERQREESKISIIPKVEYLLASYGDVETPKEKNDMLKKVIDKVVYTKECNGRWHGRVDDFKIELYPKIPKG